MDSLGSMGVFVRVAEKLSFSAVAREQGVSPSAVAKAVARMEERLGVRLLHRSTRTLALTAEGERFLERCRRILCEVEAAELEMTQASQAPNGKLRVSFPRYSGLFEILVSDFMRLYPAIELELDFSDQLVDVVGGGFDVVVRTGQSMDDSGLKRRKLGSFRKVLVASPAYFALHGHPADPAALAQHMCLQYRFPSTGRLEAWPFPAAADGSTPALPQSMVCNSLEMRIFLALQGQGIAYLPVFAVHKHLHNGQLQTTLPEYTRQQSAWWLLWPASRDTSPKLRAFIDFMSARWSPD